VGLAMAPASEAATLGNFEKPAANMPAANVYGSTLPPIGYVEFCGRGEEECSSPRKNRTPAAHRCEVGSAAPVNNYVNTKIRPATDMELYGKADYWTYPSMR